MNGFGSGKAILCGEHFVVHGEPALVLSLPLQTSVEIVPFAGTLVLDQRPKHPFFHPFKADLYEGMAAIIAAEFKVGWQYSFKLAGDLPVTSGGIGASAATAVAITRALQQRTQRPISNREVMEIALKGERVIHGNPSGIDTTAAALDGILLFKKESFVLVHHKISENQPPLPLLLVDSQKTTNIKSTIAHVAQFKDSNPLVWRSLLFAYQDLFSSLLRAVQSHKIFDIGFLFEQNHNLLRRLQLSCCHVERVRQLAQRFGALGAKMTGSCRGGLVLVAGRDQAHVASMAALFKQLGYFTVDISAGSKMSSIGQNPCDPQAAIT